MKYEKSRWRRCLNPYCRDETLHNLCLSCRFALTSGLFLGGIIGGIVCALLKVK